MGELKEVLAPALSSNNRAKSYWRGKTLKSKATAVPAFACNEVRLLISCLAYGIMNITRRAMPTHPLEDHSRRCGCVPARPP
jgi:hypothetical protein